MKIGILLFEQFHGRKDIGSSRIRGHWLAKYWPESEIFKMGVNYDVIIFQKVYWIEYAERFNGIKILDLCDADFMHWGYRVKQMIDLCDAVTTSTETLAEYIRKLTDKPVVCIPDRLDFDAIGDLRKVHNSDTTKIVGWYGYSDNLPMIDGAAPALIKMRIPELYVITQKRDGYQLPSSIKDKIKLTIFPWTADTVHDNLLKCDVILNPQSKGGRWKFKSNNKTILAWALGLPVAHNESELKGLMHSVDRVLESNRRYNEVRLLYDIRQSVTEFKNLIEKIK